MRTATSTQQSREQRRRRSDFSGQKCSACSRVIVDERVYDKFLQALKARVEKITVGDPTQNANMGPVINEKSMKTILGYIEKGIAEGGRLITGGAAAKDAGEGYFVQPTVIADVDPMATISQQEIFGPVLAVIKSRNFEDGHRHREQHRVRADGRGLYFVARQDRVCQARVPRGQPVHQSQVHGRHRGRASVRRIQHVGNRLKGGRTGLPVAVHAREVDRREDYSIAKQFHFGFRTLSASAGRVF